MQIKVFELQAVGYLLKPVKKEQLIAALDKSTRLNRLQLTSQHGLDETRRAHICARTYKGVELVNMSDIRYLRADQKYVSVRRAGGEVIIDESLCELETEFADIFFVFIVTRWWLSTYFRSRKKRVWTDKCQIERY